MNQPLVSVVTPFYNTAEFLAESIESVLAQDYTNFEYILSDNCSTDRSGEIAENYARRDRRIRFVRQTQFLSQVRHYNAALTGITKESRYCKIVQADDRLFPECLRLMIQAFEQSASIGLVSSYWLKGNKLRGADFPFRAPVVRGKELGRLYLRSGVYVFGSPTAVIYRSSMVRQQQPFYDESLLHEDTEKCMQILEDWDFAFIHQVLSFSRADNESISSAVRRFQPDALDRYILVQRYAAAFLEAGEAAAVRRESKRTYYRVLAREALRFRGRTFWRYHADGLRTLGNPVDWLCLATQIVRELLRLTLRFGTAAVRALSFGKRKLTKDRHYSKEEV